MKIYLMILLLVIILHKMLLVNIFTIKFFKTDGV